MSGTSARTIRSLSITVVALSAIAVVPLYAAGGDRPARRGREDKDKDTRQVQRSASNRESAPKTDEKATPQTSRTSGSVGQNSVAQPVPIVRPEAARPAPQRQAAPNRQYTTPEQRISPETPRRAQPLIRQRTEPQRIGAQGKGGDRDEQAERQRPAPQKGNRAERRQADQSQGRPQTVEPRRGGQGYQSRERLRPARPADQPRLPQATIERPARQTPPSVRGRSEAQPKVQFRGPEADRSVRIVRPEQRQQTQQRLRERVRTWNQERPRLTQGRPKVDAIGNPVAKDTTLIVRDKIGRIGSSYHRVREQCGDPGFYYVFAPRSRADYWQGYWDGRADGRELARRHHHNRHVVINFYYAYYWSDPAWFAFYYPGYYPSIYTYWGWSPGWVYPDRCYYSPGEYVYAPDTAYRYYGGGYYIDQRGADRSLNDIRRAWFDGDISTFAYHLTDDVDIRVYFDGEYEYSTTTEDYYAMTADAMSTTQTVSLDFDDPIWLSTNEFFVTGRHMFYDPNDERQTVYVSYRLRKLGGEWYIVSVGSSLDPIEHQYEDFRYN